MVDSGLANTAPSENRAHAPRRPRLFPPRPRPGSAHSLALGGRTWPAASWPSSTAIPAPASRSPPPTWPARLTRGGRMPRRDSAPPEGERPVSSTPRTPSTTPLRPRLDTAAAGGLPGWRRRPAKPPGSGSDPALLHGGLDDADEGKARTDPVARVGLTSQHGPRQQVRQLGKAFGTNKRNGRANPPIWRLRRQDEGRSGAP